jgi:hypothetical protein
VTPDEVPDEVPAEAGEINLFRTLFTLGTEDVRVFDWMSRTDADGVEWYEPKDWQP